MNHTAMKSRNLIHLNFDISCAASAFEILQPLRTLEVEEVWTLALSPSLKLLKAEMIFRGTVNTCLIHPREIFRFALLNNATSIIIAHNHPSQEQMPSTADIKMTNQLISAGKLIEIPLIDHLLIIRDSYFSFREKRWCEFEI